MKNKKGFTLIELIIVIAVIALLAAATFVAVDPAKRIGQARDAQRWQDVTAIADAIKMYMADNATTYPTSTGILSDSIVQVGNGSNDAGYSIMIIGFPGDKALCDPGGNFYFVDDDAIALDSLTPIYLPTLPVNPGFEGGPSTGYYFNRNSQGRITIGSCVESPYATASIYVQR